MQVADETTIATFVSFFLDNYMVANEAGILLLTAARMEGDSIVTAYISATSFEYGLDGVR